MKLYATLKNERGGKKSSGDDTRVLIELSYKNKIVGTVGLYSILDDKLEGYRVVWQDDRGFRADNVLREETKAKATDKKIEPWYCKQCKTTHTTAKSKDGEVWLCEIPF